MKKFAKLIPALALLLVSFVTLSTASYAWFSMNTTVTASNMEVTAVTPVNLLISNSASGTFANSANADEAFGTAKLYPASTNNAVKFNAIVNSGNYINNGNGGVAEADTKFQATTAVTAVANDTNGYYAVYTYAVKLSQAQETAAKVYLSDLTVYLLVKTASDATWTADTYYTKVGSVYTAVAESAFAAGSSYYMKGGLAGAVRVALIQDTLTVIYGTAASTATVNAIVGDVAADTLYKDLAASNKEDVTCVTSYTAGTADANCFEVNGDVVEFSIVVWVEGQDAACVNANAGQTVSVDFALSVK